MILKDELESEQVAHLDLTGFCQAGLDTTVAEAVARMRTGSHNVCLVIEDGRLQGIVTDRDVLRKVAMETAVLAQPITEIMTSNPITVTPETSAADALWLMDERRVRNLPVVRSDGAVMGNMTHQAVIEYLAARYPTDVLNRAPRPDQFPRKQEGG